MAITHDRTQTVKIIMVDDHPVVLEGLVSGLKLYPNIVVKGTATSVASARKLIQEGGYDVLVCDLNMPEVEDGLEIIRYAVQKNARLRVIALSYSHRPQDIYRVNQAGAHAYLIKDSDIEEIAESVLTVHAGGQPPMSPEVEAALWQAMQGSSPEGLPVMLTDREQRILSHLCSGSTNQEIADALFLSPRAVRKANTALYRKLGVRNRTGAVARAAQEGWFTAK